MNTNLYILTLLLQFVPFLSSYMLVCFFNKNVFGKTHHFRPSYRPCRVGAIYCLWTQEGFSLELRKHHSPVASNIYVRVLHPVCTVYCWRVIAVRLGLVIVQLAAGKIALFTLNREVWSKKRFAETADIDKYLHKYLSWEVSFGVDTLSQFPYETWSEGGVYAIK